MIRSKRCNGIRALHKLRHTIGRGAEVLGRFVTGGDGFRQRDVT